VRGESISDASLRSEQLFNQKFFHLFLQGYVHYRDHNSTSVITRYVETRGLWSGSLLRGVMRADHGNSSRVVKSGFQRPPEGRRKSRHCEIRGSHSCV